MERYSGLEITKLAGETYTVVHLRDFTDEEWKNIVKEARDYLKKSEKTDF